MKPPQTELFPTPAKVGRPSSGVDRREQYRQAKARARERQREQGVTRVELLLSADDYDRLRDAFASVLPGLSMPAAFVASAEKHVAEVLRKRAAAKRSRSKN